MKLCLSSRMFIVPGTSDAFEYDIEAFVRFARSAGYDGVALRAGQLDENTTPEDVSRIGSILNQFNMVCSFVMGGRVGDEEAYDRFCKLVDDAVGVGCYHLQPSVAEESEVPWIQKVCDYAQEKGVRLCPQLHDKTLHNTVTNCSKLFEMVDKENFGLNFEASHLILQKSELQGGEALKALGEKVFTICVQNYRRKDGQSVAVLPGDPGGVDFREVFDAAREIGFDGFVTHMSGRYPDLDNGSVCNAYVAAIRPLIQ